MYEFPSEYLCSDLIVTDGFIGSQYKFSIIPFFFYMPDYAPYGQENSFWFPIPSSLKLSSYWRVFQAFSLSYTLASRQFKPYFASYILFKMLEGLRRGYRHPILHSHTLPSRFRAFSEGTASTSGFPIPFSHHNK